jgi:N-methylhydantoinase B
LDGIIAGTRHPDHARGDFLAQIAANRAGCRRVAELLAVSGLPRFREGIAAMNDYGERLARAAIAAIPDGSYAFSDWLDDDGQGLVDIEIRFELTVNGSQVHCDFTGSAAQVSGNVNCPLAVAAAAVFYCFRCLMPPETPACAGALRPISLHAPEGSLLNACRPAAVTAGNVETSTRIVDVVLGALAKAENAHWHGQIPAASHGSMNNLAIGGEIDGKAWDYYETIGGGMGAASAGGGLSAVQTHMTNTLNTPVEVIESRFPLRVTEYAIRRGSGGAGRRRGGDGLVRELQTLAPAHVTLIGERRRHAPWGLGGGESGQPAVQSCNGRPLPGKCALELAPGDRLRLETAGGGGFGTSGATPER